MKILLTGSTSFLGKHLIPILEKEGYELWHLVRIPRGFLRELIWDFCSPLPENIPRVAAVIHLAAKVDFGLKFDPEQYTVNVLSAGHLARYANENGAMMVFSSTAIVHGNESSIGKGTPLSPLNHYAMTKLLAEELIRMSCRDYRILRIGGIYGLGGPVHLGLNRSITEAFYNKVVPVLKGPGQALRNYILAGDLAKWIAALVGERQAGAEARTQTLYCAGSEVMTIQDYLRQISLILTGMEDCRREDGPEGKDFIIESDAPPFVLTKFEDYLKFILKQRKVSQ